jgi:hypothetical protein
VATTDIATTVAASNSRHKEDKYEEEEMAVEFFLRGRTREHVTLGILVQSIIVKSFVSISYSLRFRDLKTYSLRFRDLKTYALSFRDLKTY